MPGELTEQVKGIVADPTKAPRLHDLLHAEVKRIVDEISNPTFDPGVGVSKEEFARRIAAYETVTAELATACAIVGYFGEPTERRLLPGIIGRLANALEQSAGQRAWLDLQRYPATLLMYAAGLGAVAGLREELLGPIFVTRAAIDVQQRPQPMVEQLFPGAVVDERLAHGLPGLERNKTPISDHLHVVMGAWLAGIVPDARAFERLFDRFEFILGLVVLDLGRDETSDGGWGPVGRFSWRGQYGGGIIQEIQPELEDPARSPLVRGGLFGRGGDRMVASAAAYIAHIGRVRFL